MTSMTNKNKILVVNVQDQKFGLNIEDIISIERVSEMTPLPQTPSFMVGVTDFRGHILSVMDLKDILFSEKQKVSENSRMVVVSIDDTQVGLLVESATDVMDMDEDEKLQSHQDISNNPNQFVKGIIHDETKGLCLMIDTKKLIRSHLKTNKEQIA